MIKGLYAVKDTKTSFWSPFPHYNDMSAIREFSNMVNSGNDLVVNNVQDFELWKLGEYDDVTGKITSKVEFVCNAISVMKVNE